MMSLVNEAMKMLGLSAPRAPSGDAIILGTVLTSAVIILGVEVLKKP